MPASVPPPGTEGPQKTPPATPQPAPADPDAVLAKELARRGVPQEEIERLLSLGGSVAEPPTAVASVAAESAPAPPPADLHPTITLPAPREASAAQRAEAERIFRTAALARRRGQVEEAAELCRQALEQTPADTALVEFYGDMLQALGRVDDALYCYKAAWEGTPARASAEAKYGELMLLQNRDIEMLRDESVRVNPTLAVLISAVAPGMGQLCNGQPAKGLAVGIALLLTIALMLWSPWGYIPHQTSNRVPPSVMFFALVAVGIYLYALVDTHLTGQRAKPKSGWDV